jgi:hypothetical protein
MNAEQIDHASWLRLHHREMRRYLRLLAGAKERGASPETICGLRRWVGVLHANAQNAAIRFRNAAEV